MKNIKFFFLALLLAAGFAETQAQTNEVYKDKETKKKGVRDEFSKEIIVKAQYDDISINGLNCVVKNNGKYGVIDLSGAVLYPIEFDYLYAESIDPNHLSEILTTNKSGSYYAHTYYISPQGKCLSYNYYPCPLGVKIDSSKMSIGQKYLQKGIEKVENFEFEAGIELVKKAIAAEPKHAAYYYWYVKFYMDLYLPVIKKAERKSKVAELEQKLLRAAELEKDEIYTVLIENLRYQLYAKYLKKADEKQAVSAKLTQLNSLQKSTGIFAQAGIAYAIEDFAIEISLAYGSKTNAWHRELMPNEKRSARSTYYFGAGYEHYVKAKTSVFKAHIYSLQAPFSFGIYPLLATDYQSLGFGVKPEIGLHYKGFNLSYGYNFLNKDKFPTLKTHVISLRYNLFWFGTKEFRYHKKAYLVEQ